MESLVLVDIKDLTGVAHTRFKDLRGSGREGSRTDVASYEGEIVTLIIQ